MLVRYCDLAFYQGFNLDVPIQSGFCSSLYLVADGLDMRRPGPGGRPERRNGSQQFGGGNRRRRDGVGCDWAFLESPTLLYRGLEKTSAYNTHRNGSLVQIDAAFVNTTQHIGSLSLWVLP